MKITDAVREDVLRLMVRGLKYREIASELGMAVGTVGTVANRLIRAGMVPPRQPLGGLWTEYRDNREKMAVTIAPLRPEPERRVIERALAALMEGSHADQQEGEHAGTKAAVAPR